METCTTNNTDEKMLDQDSSEELLLSVRKAAEIELKQSTTARTTTTPGTTTTGSESTSGDLYHLLQSTCALISTNEEIWKRCESNLCRNLQTTDLDPGKLRFKRLAYSSIAVSTVNKGNQTYAEFRTTPELSMKEFYRPARIPPELCRLVIGTMSKEGIFPEYGLFFRSSLLLHDSVLIPFLAKLKAHLEDIQVYLGEIESWLMYAFDYMSFIQETFHIKLSIPDDDDCGCRSLCSRYHDDCAICLHCYKIYRDHFSGFSLDGQKSKHVCTKDTNHRASFFVPKPQILCHQIVSGNLSLSFDITDPKEQVRLKAFLGFCSTYN